VLLFCGATLATLAVATPGHFFRYLAPVIPPLAILAALILESALRLSRPLGAMGVVCVVVMGPLLTYALDGQRDNPLRSGVVPVPMAAYLYEITHDIGGPLKCACQYLNAHAHSTDVVAISYGDMTLKFHTPLRVVGGLTGEDPALIGRADWVVERHYTTASERPVSDAILRSIRRDQWEEITLDSPDAAFENREAPDQHRYRPVPADRDPVILLHRLAPVAH
jgi:hypothetical protein